jgi:putative membrane protein
MKTLICLASLTLAACTADTAQRAHPTPGRQPVPSASLAPQDREFLERATEGNIAEVAIGSLVEGRARLPEVAAFGKMIAADHASSQKQLTAIAAAKKIAVPTSLGEHQSSYDRLVDLKGDEFDREFVKVMIDEHHMAIELFRGEAMNGTDPALKLVAATALPRLQTHLQHAQALSAKVPRE